MYYVDEDIAQEDLVVAHHATTLGGRGNPSYAAELERAAQENIQTDDDLLTEQSKEPVDINESLVADDTEQLGKDLLNSIGAAFNEERPATIRASSNEGKITAEFDKTMPVVESKEVDINKVGNESTELEVMNDTIDKTEIQEKSLDEFEFAEEANDRAENNNAVEKSERVTINETGLLAVEQPGDSIEVHETAEDKDVIPKSIDYDKFKSSDVLPPTDSNEHINEIQVEEMALVEPTNVQDPCEIDSSNAANGVPVQEFEEARDDTVPKAVADSDVQDASAALQTAGLCEGIAVALYFSCTA